jgi:hypothetical protein
MLHNLRFQESNGIASFRSPVCTLFLFSVSFINLEPPKVVKGLSLVHFTQCYLWKYHEQVLMLKWDMFISS